MRTDKTTIYELFEKQRRYIVPLFQRGYVWNEQNQWKPLWDDLLDEAGTVARHRREHTEHFQKHFMGAVVLNLIVHALREVPVVEIIDGQQRLTTLQILLAAIRDETSETGSPYMRADLERLTRNGEPLRNGEERYKVWPTSALQEHFRNVLDAGSMEDLEARYAEKHRRRYGKWDPPRPAVVEAYVYFSRCVRAYLDDDPEELPIDLVGLSAADRADVLVEALMRDIQLVTIELEHEDDAQVIFETLNARGEPLTPSDLVRNFVFLTATRQRMDVEALYVRRWRVFEEDPPERPFWKQQERQGRLRRPRLDLFLFHYVTLMTGKELKIGHLYQAFRDWWEDGAPRDIEHELEALGRHAAVYRVLLDPVSSSGHFATFAARLRAMDTTTPYPVVLWAAEAFGTDAPAFGQIIGDIESYLVRRMVCGYHQKAYNRTFLDLLARLRKGESVHAAQVVRDYLAASPAASTLWPSDEEFEESLRTEPLYRTVQARRVLPLLSALNTFATGPFAEEVEIKSSLSVEHVLPQGAAAEHWPLEVGVAEDEGSALARRARLLHTLGNLTLVTQPLNSSVSNGPYSDKRRDFKQSVLTLNRYFDGVERWDEAAIERRGVLLAEAALRVWPRPGASHLAGAAGL